MKWEIIHRTEYTYASPVSESFNEVRLHPVSDESQQVNDFLLKILPATRLRHHRDFYSNIVHHFEIPEPHTTLLVESLLHVTTHPRPPLADALAIDSDFPEAQFALGELLKIPGVRRTFDAPFFNEFTVELPRSVKIVNSHLLREKIVGPLALGTPYPELTKNALVCVTETTPRAEIERFAGAVKRALEQPL